MDESKKQFARDLLSIGVSIAVAVFLVKSGLVYALLNQVSSFQILGEIIAGMFFVSAFTVAPAGVVLFEIAKTNPILAVAFWGAIGSVVGDLIIFRFIEDNLAEDIKWVMKKTGHKKLLSIFKQKLWRWLVPFVGALIVALPFPDEIGLAMMGLSKMKTRVFIPVSFVLNFLGILLIAYLAHFD